MFTQHERLIRRQPRPTHLAYLPRHITHSPTPLFFTCTCPNDLQQALLQPYRFLFEMRKLDTFSDRLRDLSNNTDYFLLSLSTQTAHAVPVADIMANHMAGQFHLNDKQRSILQTCLQEALSNAIIHGNLDVDIAVDDVDSFTLFYNQVDERAANPRFGERRIEIRVMEDQKFLNISLSDQGKGFSLLPPTSRKKIASMNGRGLYLIQKLADRVWMGNDKNTLHMSFKL